MKALNKLETLLKEDPKVHQFKVLEKAIFENQEMMKAYQDLLNKQKRMIQAQEKQSPNLSAVKREYDKALKTIQENPIIEQYLTLQEDINADIKMLFQIIEQEIND